MRNYPYARLGRNYVKTVKNKNLICLAQITEQGYPRPPSRGGGQVLALFFTKPGPPLLAPLAEGGSALAPFFASPLSRFVKKTIKN